MAGARVDERLAILLPSATERPMELHTAMRYSCLAPGKRLRPALVLGSAEVFGVTEGAVLDAACAVEMIHCFSLIHDDLPAIDNDDLRRGRPTCHIEFGEAIAILAGDALFALAFETCARLEAAPEAVVEVLRLLTHCVGSDGLVGGEIVDVLSEGKVVDRETLEYIHSRKTGALIRASCEIGAVLAGASPAACAALREYGDAVGLAFQIADDVLNETSTPEQIGKSAGSDREREKATYPALFGLDASRKMALEAADRGIAALSGLGATEFLEGLARFSVDRVS